MDRTAAAVARYARTHSRGGEPVTAWGRCIIESDDFLKRISRNHPRLRLIRVTGESYPGREHWAVIDWADDADDPAEFTIYDLTLRQFLPSVEFPYTGTLIDWYDLIVDAFNDNLNVAVFTFDSGVAGTDLDDPDWADTYTRDDVEPGEPGYVLPWERA